MAYNQRGALTSFDVDASRAVIDALIDGPVLGRPELALIERYLARFPGSGMREILEAYALKPTKDLKALIDQASLTVASVRSGRVKLFTCGNGWNTAARLNFICDLMVLRSERRTH